MAKAKVVWRERALVDIDRPHNFLFTKNEEAAAKVARVILRGSSLLEDSPRLGRPMAAQEGVNYLSPLGLVFMFCATS